MSNRWKFVTERYGTERNGGEVTLKAVPNEDVLLSYISNAAQGIGKLIMFEEEKLLLKHMAQEPLERLSRLIAIELANRLSATAKGSEEKK